MARADRGGERGRMSQKATRWLDKRRSVTGFLLPAEASASSATASLEETASLAL